MRILCVNDISAPTPGDLGHAALSASANPELNFIFWKKPSELELRVCSEFNTSRIYYFSDILHSELLDFPAAIKEIVNLTKPCAIIFSSAKEMKVVSSILAAQLEVGVISEVTAIERSEKGEIISIKPTFAEDILVKITSSSFLQMLCVKQNFFTKKTSPKKDSAPSVIEMKMPGGKGSFQLLDSKKSETGETVIESCPVVIGAGRGVSRKNFEKLKELAKLLNAGLGVTRPLVEDNYAPEECQIGLTGKSISPDIYIAFGISGKLQHRQGITGAKCVISINKDKNSDMNKIADYFICADINEILGPLIELLKKTRNRVY